MLMGPLMTVGAYFAVSGTWSVTALWLSLPIGLLVAAILHGNEWRDISEDTRAGITTLSSRVGRDFAHYAYLGMTIGAYVVLGLTVVFLALPPTVMLALLSLPLLAVVIRAAELTLHPPSPSRAASSDAIARAKRTGGACCDASSARAAANQLRALRTGHEALPRADAHDEIPVCRGEQMQARARRQCGAEQLPA